MRLAAVFLLCWFGASGGDAGFKLTNYEHEKLPLPPTLVGRIAQGIEFAFRIGAAKEIGYSDLQHAHLLYGRERKALKLAEPDAILLHAQEMATYGPEAFRKRNIFLRPGVAPEVLGCWLGKHLYRFGVSDEREEFCTVDNVDLGMENQVDIMFMDVDRVDASALKPYGGNVRLAAGHKLLFYITGYRPGMFADR